MGFKEFINDRIFIILGGLIIFVFLFLPWGFATRTQISDPSRIQYVIITLWLRLRIYTYQAPAFSLVLTYFDEYTMFIGMAAIATLIGSAGLIVAGALPKGGDNGSDVWKLLQLIIPMVTLPLIFISLLVNRSYLIWGLLDYPVMLLIGYAESSTYTYLMTVGPAYIVAIAAAGVGAFTFLFSPFAEK